MTLLPILQEFRATDPEAFGATATPDRASRLVLRGRGPFEGWRSRFAPDDLMLNEGLVNVAATFSTAVGPRAIFSLAPPDVSDATLNGGRLAPHAIAWWRAEAEVHTRWPGGLPWWNVVVPLPRFEAAAGALLGAPLLTPRDSVHFAPLTPERHGALLSALDRARRAPAGARVSDVLLRLLLDALEPSPPNASPSGGGRTARARRQAIVDGLVALADEREGPRSLIAVCESLGVPLRTLNAASNAVLGVSAGAYLRQRRLNRVFVALRDGVAASVTEAAMRHGFWELGRFAASYRALFGETPSRTLRRAGRAS